MVLLPLAGRHSSDSSGRATLCLSYLPVICLLADSLIGRAQAVPAGRPAIVSAAPAAAAAAAESRPAFGVSLFALAITMINSHQRRANDRRGAMSARSDDFIATAAAAAINTCRLRHLELSLACSRGHLRSPAERAA